MKKLLLLLFTVFVLTGCENIDDINRTARDINYTINTVKDLANTVKEVLPDDLKNQADIFTEKITSTQDTYYTVLGEADFQHDVEDGIHYGKLDKHKRPTYATARITKELYEKEKTEPREKIKVNPVGWNKNKKVQIGTYKGYFWNRSHMIADSFGGEPIKENLITGTRCQNVGGRDNKGGMAYLETKIRDYFKINDGYVDYEVINIYKDKEIIPRKTIVNALSSDGIIDESVEVYNEADGYTINYTNATFKKK